MTNTIFEAYSHYYDLIYQDKDYKIEFEYINSLLSRFNINNGSILEFGSGTGKHGCLFAKAGYTVHGIDLSAEMIAKAQRYKGFSCEQGDITSINLGKNYNLILSLFHVINYQVKNQQLQAVFANASRHLNSGGLFIFDFWYSPAVYHKKPQIRVKRVKNKKIEITRIAEPEVYPNENKVNVNYTIFIKDLTTGFIQTLKEVHQIRHLNLLEINILSDIHGFTIINAEEFITGKVLSEETWGACVVLKKI
jgi:SAM-dependent methyltransferase